MDTVDRHTSRRAFCGALAALSALPIVGRSAEKRVSLLSWGGTVQSTFEKEGWADRFLKDTGYTLSLVPKATSAEIIAAAIAQKAKPQVDVVMCDLPAWWQGHSQKIFVKLDAPKLPNTANLAPSARIADHGVAPYGDVLCIVYSPAIFKEKGWALPKTVSDLARPEFKGRLIMPPVSNTYGMYGLVELARANGGSEKNVEPGFQALKKIAPNVLEWTDTHAKMVSLFQQGTAAVALYANASGHDMRSRGVPVDIVIPDPSYLSSTVAGIMEGSPNPEGANALLNWLIGKDFLGYRAERYGNTPLNSSVRVEGEAAKKVVQGAALAKLLQLDYAEVARQRAAWNQRFEREVLTLT